MHILYMPNDCSVTGDLPFLVWSGIRAIYDWQVMAMKLDSRLLLTSIYVFF